MVVNGRMVAVGTAAVGVGLAALQDAQPSIQAAYGHAHWFPFFMSSLSLAVFAWQHKQSPPAIPQVAALPLSQLVDPVPVATPRITEAVLKPLAVPLHISSPESMPTHSVVVPPETDFHTLVPLPPRVDINTGLTSAQQDTMLLLFGTPGRLTLDCSAITNASLRTHIVTRNLGIFSVTGWGPAIDSLEKVLNRVKAENPALHAVVRTAGMLCCRAVRDSTSHYSNHSWGTAIDLKIQSELDEMGAEKVQKGIYMLYHYFHQEGWYWAAGYSGRKDPMHFELADETVRAMHKHLLAA